MNPAFSVILFTTLAGAAQGLVVGLALALLAGVPVSAGFALLALGLALALLLISLGASFLHLGRPERAWRAVMMWRTSWLSREVIVLPAFIGVTALWWLALWSAGPQPGPLTKLALPLLVSALAGLLWLCTAQIYNCLRFIQEWAHPLTLVNYTLIGLSSGLVLGCAVAVLAGEQAWLAAAAPWTLAATAAAGLGRGLALRRNARLKPVSTLQSATGIQARRLVQTSMGMTGGAFNTREFFHGATLSALRQLRVLLMVFGFGLPLLCLAAGCWQLRAAAPGPGAAWPWLLALAFQAPGLLAERWMFFAQARHPQNLYYQVVS